MRRSLQPELMDALDMTGAVLDKFHRDLARVHRLLGTFQTVERLLRNDDRPVRRVLDIGCGGGALLEYLRGKMGVEVIGIDSNPGRIADVPILKLDAVREHLPEADVAVSTLVAHHLTPDENVQLIRNAGRSGELWPVAAGRIGELAVVLVAAAVLRRSLLPRGAGGRLLLVAAGAGAIDVIANISYVAATRTGQFGLAVVLASLYPGITVLLARVVLGERLRWAQRAGLGLAAIGIILVAA